MLDDMEAYWRSKCAGGRLPSRRAIDPVEIPRLLSTIYLIDVAAEAPPPRFRFRLLGTGIVEAFGRNLTGCWLDEVYAPEVYAPVAADYGEAMRTRTPRRAAMNMPVEGREFLRYERVVCPLASDGATVDTLVGVIAFLS